MPTALPMFALGSLLALGSTLAPVTTRAPGPIRAPATTAGAPVRPTDGPAAEEPVLGVDMLDNGDFVERYEGTAPDRVGRLPWWRAEGNGRPLAVVEDGEDGEERWLVTEPGQVAAQPFVAYAPLVRGLRIEGRVEGAGVVSIVDGPGGRARFEVSGPEPFSIDGDAIRAQLGRAIAPRLEIELAAAGETAARWTTVRALVPLPAPGPAELRAEIVERIDEIVAMYVPTSVDPATGFVTRLPDAVTGATVVPLTGGVFPLWQALLEALPHEDRAAWRAPLEAFLESYLERCFAPGTGLPARWRFDAGAPALDDFVEVHADLRFLLDVAAIGPQRFRAPALERARAIGDAVLEHGVLPDGYVAAAYRPRDGQFTLVTSHLRRLDVPAQLVRLSAATGDERLADAARNALAAFEYTHIWPCTWEQIDPGFDDNLGIFGARAVTMIEGRPEDAAFRGFVASGWDYYAPRWRDCLRFGGTVAADQVRCWRLLLDYSELEPAAAPGVRALVPPALRAHLKGEQYANGAWGDVTFAGFDPADAIQVGDLPGTPANLLEGLALAYDPELDVDLAEVRALYASVLRSTVEHYRRPHGYLMSQRQRADQNSAGGGLRMLAGLVEMLGRLEE